MLEPLVKKLTGRAVPPIAAWIGRIQIGLSQPITTFRPIGRDGLEARKTR